MMKKLIIPILIAGCMFSTSITAMGASIQDVNVTGDFRLRGYSIEDNIAGADKIPGVKTDDSYLQFIGRINLNAKIADNTTFFSRFGMRNRLGQSMSDGNFNNSYQQIDQYGIRTTQGDWNLSIGRQAVKLGQGMLISTGDEVEYDNKFDGLVATTKMGAANLKLIAGKTSTSEIAERLGGVSSTWYGAEVSGMISPKTSMGFSFANDKPKDSNTSVSSWAVNTSVNVAPNLWLNAEYAKSNANSNNAAYLIGGAYVTAKDVFVAQYQNVEKNAVNQSNSLYSYVNFPFQGVGMSFTNSWDGWFYKYNHIMDKNTSLHVIYMDTKAEGLSGRDKEVTVGIAWGF
ncbi:hypothetical protein SPSIL_051940 [Sporomusa silvacetica DSM 10669]|uniref:Porin domain-containing protein n=1 Tax=Sporomusa silvacetica DSM 10669 TaxID=1123289 RepID=A0ABZ3ITB3_9FIRM|nr:hypothetical protein [Sporomusa silvacetica]OZC22301.1 hypothetical protein SPSIL_06070 [Sporomusa silvacetica DSM 10669]